MEPRRSKRIKEYQQEEKPKEQKKKTKKRKTETEEEPKVQVEKVEEKIIVDESYNRNAKTLEDLDYTFTKEGELRHIKTGGKFEFLSQSFYQLLTDIVAKYIQQQMKDHFNMQEIQLPLDARRNEPTMSIFASHGYEKSETLLVVICGSGQVKAGQWGRSLCVNDSLNSGSILPYLESAFKLNYGVLVLNPNETSTLIRHTEKKKDPTKVYVTQPSSDGKTVEDFERVPIRENVEPFQHVLYVAKHFVFPSQSKNIVFVAHSFGGYLASQLISDKEKEIFGKAKTPSRVTCIAFSDSVHTSNPRWSARVKAFLKKNSRNWARSTTPLDSPLRGKGGCPVVSAGTDDHDLCSSKAIKSVFKFFQEKIEEKSPK